MPKLLLRILWILLLCPVLAAAAAAQTTGTVRGEVVDQEGTRLPGVTVTATNEERGTSRSVITGASGTFVLSALPVGPYGVSASLDGFLTQDVEDVRVGIGSTVKLELVMPPESVSETITVTSAPVLDVTSSSVGSNYSAEFIEDLPTNRNFWDLMAVSPGISAQSEGSTNMSAFGSSITSNSWSIDGLDTTNADTGNAWWYINPETIEEIQVLAIGAPAQYGNMSGAAFNVVTKSGTNQFSGSLSAYYQADDWVEENAEINGIPYHRDEFHDISATLGGPIKRDKIWFFGSYQNYRDSFSEPGVDPNVPTAFPSDRYDLKINASISAKSSLDAKYHYEDYDWVYGDAFSTLDATANQFGTNPAWGIGFDTVLGAKSFLEINYAGYRGDEDWLSRTRSTADPFIDYSPPDGGPPRFSGSLYFPYSFDLSRDQADVALSTHADDLLTGDHDLKFGISYGTGDGDTITGGGINGVYYYRYEYTYEYYGYEYTYPYYYRVTARPYHYGAETENISAFVDDSWQVTENLTINLGVRYDQINSDIPDYAKLNQDWSETGEIIPGLQDAVTWEHVSPRIGFALKTGEKGVLRGFYGKFYDANVTGNWYAPPPDAPSYVYEFSASPDGPWEEFFLFEQNGATVDPNLNPPETDQFTIGYEHQVGTYYTLGIQAIYKETENLIGWEILDDGVYEMVPWTNPFSGETVQLAGIVVQPSTRKGNGPGPGSLAPPGTKYHQDYTGGVLSFKKRHSDGWGMQASYTWSDSEGFLPRPLSQSQGSPFYTGGEGRDPNNWINANQALQNEREHVFQAQANFDLPWDLNANVIYRFLSGKPFSRQVRVGSAASGSPLNQGNQTVIAVPAGDERLPDQNVLDLALGRGFDLGSARLKIDLQLFNAFNEDSHDWWESLIVPPGERFVPSGYLAPRRWMVRFSWAF